MTSIEVPDWVVRSVSGAMEDWHNNPANETGYNATLKAALTAALGAWVVPVPQYGGEGCSDWFDGVLPPHEAKNPEFKTRTLFTLRQEKPE